jgi:hypothetical protein
MEMMYAKSVSFVNIVVEVMIKYRLVGVVD